MNTSDTGGKDGSAKTIGEDQGKFTNEQGVAANNATKPETEQNGGENPEEDLVTKRLSMSFRKSTMQSDSNKKQSTFQLVNDEEYDHVVNERGDSDDEEEYRYKEYDKLQQQVEAFQTRIVSGAQTSNSKKGAGMRGLVSKNKSRFVTDEFNLDLTCNRI